LTPCCTIDAVLQLLTGAGLSASAGLNAWIPLLAVGLLARYTELVTLPAGWGWLSNGWVLAILTVLLLVELVADKIPVVDTANDVLQTVVRPTSGGLVFGAGSSAETAAISDPGELFSGRGWVPIAVGVVIALVVHAIKAIARPILNTLTAGFGAPVVSTAEDATSVVMSLVALLLPVLVIVFLAGMVALAWWAWRRRRRRRAARAAARIPR
jgi:cbb3-type cytochrome oxidase subunit 3